LFPTPFTFFRAFGIIDCEKPPRDCDGKTTKQRDNGGISIMAKKNILIVIDVQNDFITGALRNEEAIKKLPNIVKLIKDNEWDEIFLTMDTHDKNTYLTKTLEGQKLPVEHCIKGTWGWEKPKELQDVLAGKITDIFEKDTFGSVWLADNLAATHYPKEDCEFTIVGYCTDICVVSNALLIRAHFPNSTIKVLRDCTAGVTPETHEAALKTMEMCQIEVI
jgi:nicotinamidase-related amidase